MIVRRYLIAGTGAFNLAYSENDSYGLWRGLFRYSYFRYGAVSKRGVYR